MVPTYNRRVQVLALLRALSRQTASPDDFEVVVVDDGSVDGTMAAVEALDVPYRLRVLAVPHGGACGARNAGAASADTDLLLFLDDDVVPSTSLVERHLAAHRDAHVVCFGRIDRRSDTRDRLVLEMDAAARAHADRMAEGRSATPGDCHAGNLSLRRDDFIAAGGFPEGEPLGGDVELALRLEANGLRFRFVADATVEHIVRTSRGAILEHLRVKGRTDARLHREYGGAARFFLAGFRDGTPREALLRRLWIFLRVPPLALAALRPLARLAGVERLWCEHVSRLAYWSGVRSSVDRASWRGLVGGTPILMYHSFAVPGERQTRYVVSRRRLSTQLWLLRILRRRVITLDHLVECLSQGRPAPPRSVVITIDDGSRDVVEVAAPALHAHGMPSTLFVLSGRKYAALDWTDVEALSGRPLLSREDLLRLPLLGMSIGSHTRNHTDLPTVGDEEVQAEIEGSRADLEAALGRPVPMFAYPFGRYDDRSRAAVRSAGYLAAVSVRPGINTASTPLDLLHRHEVKGTDPLWLFVRSVLFPAAPYPPRGPISRRRTSRSSSTGVA